MKIATWNVNSLRVRLEHVQNWLTEHKPDVLCLQEIKMTNDDFPIEAIQECGYHSSFNGQKTYNGVANLSLSEPSDVLLDIPELDDPQRRFIAATYGETRVINIYVPNGQALDSDKFVYKQQWFEKLHNHIEQQLQQHEKVVLLGDFNITPTDDDVHDPEEWAGQIHCSDTERDMLADLMQLGLYDTFRKFEQEEKSFSWWDYRAAAFRRNRGLRIDLILNSDALHQTATSCYIDKQPRKLERPSDHTPVVVEFDL